MQKQITIRGRNLKPGIFWEQVSWCGGGGLFSLLWFSFPFLLDVLIQPSGKQPESVLPQHSLLHASQKEIVWGLYECEAHGTWPVFQDDSKNLYFYASLLCHSLMFSKYSGAILRPGLLAPKEQLEDTVWDMANALTTHVVS